MKKFLGTLFFIPLVIWLTIVGFRTVMFNRDCGGHLKRAADANTIQLAIQELKVSVKYIEDNGMTSGYTSVFYNTPDEDLGFWYVNLKSSLEELEKVKPETSQLERSNLLLKLRQTLLDHSGKDGETVTKPAGISRYPSNSGFAWGFIMSLVMALVSAGMWFVGFYD